MLPLYKNIKNRRKELKLTQSELAERTGYADKSMIAKIEKGLIDLPLSKIEVFANALETTPSELMGDTWESDILDNARRDIVEHFNGDAYAIAKFQEAEFNDMAADSSGVPYDQPTTMAAHFDGDEYTEDELDEIRQFAAFVKNRKK